MGAPCWAASDEDVAVREGAFASMSHPCERERCEHLHLHIWARSSSIEDLTTTHGAFPFSFYLSRCFPFIH